MAVPSTRQSAKDLVEQIAKDHGYLGEEKLRRIEPALRREIEEAFFKKDLMTRSTIIKLAKKLYTSKACFIFELLQNADRNSYYKAIAQGVTPYVSFRVYPSRIVLECNEDGFNDEDLAALCSVGQSSKAGAQGYMGEKGFGFKSVFMAAWKAHIQSGAFSFSLTHKIGDSGMGMISPIWEDDAKQVLGSPLTRITLHLHVTGDSDMLAKTRETIQEQFKELQETVLLFMKKLRKISVAFYNDEEEQTSSTTYSIKRPRAHYTVLKRTKVTNNQEETELKHFHVTTQKVTNLAKNENINYSKSEETTHAYSRSQVVLAFPLTDTSIPIIEPQALFTFLPVSQVGFNFLIQADFVTDASLQDIIKDSPRNNTLLDGIADAFTKAILQFCEHDTLRYQWMKYLPDKNSSVWGSFEFSLIDKIAARLSTTPVLFGRRKPAQRLINDLFRLDDDALDTNGTPLFGDGEPDQLISLCYDKEALEILSSYGLQFASYQEIRGWLKNDLKRGQRSRMKSPQTSQSWHTRAAKLLQRHFTSQPISNSRINEIKQLDLLPLEDGTWVSASSGSVYFAQVDGLDIPPGIDLQVISKSMTNPSRKCLFMELGVKTAPISLVRDKILQKYPYEENSSSLSLSTSKSHLEFLYLSHHLQGNNISSYSGLSIFDTKMEFLNPHLRYVYVASDELYGPWELLRQTDPGPKPGDGAPGHLASFVNKEYFENSPGTPQDQNLTWREWLYSKLNVKRTIDLGSSTLSPVGLYVQRNRPERFLGYLHSWIRGGGHISAKLANCLRETEVLCRGNRQLLLKNTHFPTRELEKRVEQYVEHGAFFPWLWLDTEGTLDAIPSAWKFVLAKIKIDCSSTDLDFALDMLNYSLDAFPETINHTSRDRLFGLYNHIQATFQEEEDRVKALEKIQMLFSERKCIYIPLTVNRYTWAFPNECVWNAPQALKSKYALRHLYERWLLTDGANFAFLENFVTSTLGVVECTWQTYVHELKVLSESGCNDIGTISGIYAALDTLRPKIFGLRKDELQIAFEDDALIYLPLGGGREWHKASQCVWSSAARLRGRVSLNDEYKHLEELFVKLIGVKPVDLLMAIDELKEAGNKQSTSVQEMKESIWTVNSLLYTESQSPSPSGIMNSRIFPIKHPNGSITLGPRTAEFFIVDREPFRRIFDTRVKFLNFTLEEITQLRPFLKWMDLGTRYLSHCVKEKTSFHGGVAIQTSNSNRQVRNRAHALLRIAAHFNSPRLNSKRNLGPFYQVLRSADIFETDGISSILSLSQNGFPHEEPGQTTTLHLDEDDRGLKIYLPSNKDDQEYTFTKALPQRLFEWMMTDPLAHISGDISKDGVIATRDVLLAPRSRIATALYDNGIATINIVNTDEEPLSNTCSPATPVRTSEARSEMNTPNSQGDSDSGILDTPASSIMSLPLRPRHASAWTKNSYSMPSTPRPISTSPLLLPSRPTTPALITPTKLEIMNHQYISLLDKVINAGRRGTLPNCGEPNMSQLQSSVPSAADTSDWGLSCISQIERDCKVGAAGELYVFELLYHLSICSQLPGFSRNNWQSNIRKYVTVHPEYANMEPGLGSETSDMVYTDSTGFLTRHLIERGYVGLEKWKGKKPKYCIDVKTTFLSCEMWCFISEAQHRRLADNFRNTANRDTIYMIFRVYNLGRDNMGVKIYLKPYSTSFEAFKIQDI